MWTLKLAGKSTSPIRADTVMTRWRELAIRLFRLFEKYYFYATKPFKMGLDKGSLRQSFRR